MEPPGSRFIDGCIVFNGSKSVFYSGQVLEGKINFELSSPLNISAIDIVFLGEGIVQWIEEQVEMYNGVRRQKFLKYLGREEYFNQVQRLTQGPSVLQAGNHSIPFSFELPFACPSSFKGEKGQVTYSVTVHFIHQDGVTKDKIETEFDVIDPLNLNTGSADIKNPLVMEFEEVLSCACSCSSQPLCVTVRLPAQGVCPGQVVPVGVAVRNTTSVEITHIIFQITSRERYRSQQPPSEYEPPEEVLSTLRRGPILSNTRRDFEFELTVPDLIAPNMEHCSIIDVGYFFKVTIKLSGCNEDLEDEAEICIGLVPLGESPDFKHHPLADKLPDGPIPVPDPNNAFNMPPAYQSLSPDQQNHPQTNPPYPANDASYGSKNSLVGSFEIGFRASGASPAPPHPVPGYPYPGQAPGHPYPGQAPGQSPPYPAQPYGSQPSAPSAPPPYLDRV